MKPRLLIALGLAAVLIVIIAVAYPDFEEEPILDETNEVTELMEDDSELASDSDSQNSTTDEEKDELNSDESEILPTDETEEPTDTIDEPEETASAVTFNLTGKNFEFSQSSLSVKEGDTVRIVFTSESGTHDWVVDEFNASTATVTAGNTTEVTFVADKAGVYEYYCSIGSHRAMGMFGELVVE